MDPGSRVERDPMSGAQQTSDEPGTGGQWESPVSRSQGKWEQRQDDSGQQRTEDWGQGTTGTGATSDRYDTSGQYGGQESFASDPTSGSADPTMGRTGYAERDDDLAGAGGGGRPSATSKTMGTAEKMAGKITGDPGKQARGEERKEGMY